MEIAVDKNMKLVSDSTGWTLMTRRPLARGPRAGQVDWATDGHYDTLQWALVGAFKASLGTGAGAATLAQLARRIDQVEARLRSIAESMLDQTLGDGGGGAPPVDPWSRA